jgi:threonylcarbamoyladenosine tRNA methylthiotransferase MtaB
VLCGVFLGAYDQPTTIRRKWTRPSALPELLRRVAQTPGLWRVRLSSLEPGDVTDELLKIFRDCPTVAPHLHLPMQSGSDHILKRMNRQYSREQFLDAVRRVRETIDDAAITTDVVVGFPGESEADFADTLEIARQSEFSKIHIFPFSPRPGTAAWNWRKEAPPSEVVKTRCAKLAELERELAENFRKKFIGRTVEALVEQPNSKTPPACARGLTDRYIEITFPKNAGEDLTGKIARLRIERLSNGGLVGVLVKKQ